MTGPDIKTKLIRSLAGAALWAVPMAALGTALFPDTAPGWQQQTSEASYQIPLGPVTGYRHIDAWLNVDGELDRRLYQLSANDAGAVVDLTARVTQVKSQLAAAGYSVLAEGLFPARNLKGDIGGNGWMTVALLANPLPQTPEAAALTTPDTGGGSAFVAAQSERAEGNRYIALYVRANDRGEQTILVDRVQAIPAATLLQAIAADTLTRALADHGRAVLSGLLFEPGAAALQPQSEQTLAEIARYLNQHPDRRYYLVGHSDATGSFDYNRKLSLARARQVVQVLVQQHGIPADQLSAQGIGPLSPLFRNDSPEGRQRNRRVELVER